MVLSASKNCIVLKNPSETGRLKDRKIFYEIDSIGENIRYTNRGNDMNLLLEHTKQNWVMILVRHKEVMLNPKLCFFTESGDLIEEENLCLKEEGYVVLMTIYRDKKLIKGHTPFWRVSYPWPIFFLQSKPKQQKGVPL